MKRLVIVMCVVTALLLAGCSVAGDPGSADGRVHSDLPQGPMPPGGSPQGDGVAKVTVDPDIFDRQGKAYEDPEAGWEGPSPYFLVNSDQQEKAAEALYVAGRRLMYVDNEGNIVSESELANPQGYTKYTPNYCSPVYLTDAGPVIYLDTKGELPRAMADRMLRIVVEEIVAQGITAHLTTPPLDTAESIYGSPEWEPPNPKAPLTSRREQ